MTAHDSAVRRFFSSRWYVIVGGIILLFLLFSYFRAFYQSYQIEREIARLQSEKERLDSKYLKTVEMLKYVQTPAYVEGKARVELGMVKPGEHAAIVQGVGARTVSRQDDDAMVQSEANPILWWHYFFGKR